MKRNSKPVMTVDLLESAKDFSEDRPMLIIMNGKIEENLMAPKERKWESWAFGYFPSFPTSPE